jgi:predicted glycosyltransferase involved in capsule biosynthesis
VVECLSQREEIGCVGGVVRNIYENKISEVISKAMASPFGIGFNNFRSIAKDTYVDTIGSPAFRKSIFDEVGFFDERLLGLGEEDGDFFWRYHQKYQREIPSIDVPLIDNIQSDLADEGYTKGIRTASLFNRDFVQRVKYKNTLLGGYRGMFDKKVKQSLEDEKQYPYELFYLDNKNKL